MRSKEPLELAIPATDEDIAALRRARRESARIRPEDYLKFLSQFTASPAALRARKGPRGEPFKL
jgi:hypothetical protein